MLLAAAAALLLLVLEWLFFVTKPSMFSVMGWPEKTAVLASSALPLLLAAGLLAALLTLAGGLWPARWGGRSTLGPILVAVVPALLLAAAVFLLVENFTMTVAGFNLGNFRSPLRYLYAAGLVLLLFLFHRRLRRLAASGALAPWRRAAALGLAALLALLALVTALRFDPHGRAAPIATSGERPSVNVLILASDGLDAERMSVYGAARQTTPFLDSRAGEFLVSENHVSNAAVTAGSTGALLTGKLPTTTGVNQQFRVFRGRDVYEHLPGVLRQLGYYGIEIGERHYADSHDQNLRLGFHVSNERKLIADDVAILGWYTSRYPTERHFLGSVSERVRARVAHAFNRADMTGPLAPEQEESEWSSDEQRIAALKDEIARAPRPFFAHVHLLDTHAHVRRVRAPHFSPGGRPTRDREMDYFDDSIRGFDRFVEDVMLHLETLGELDRTILILNTDHGAHYDTSQRQPLLMRFPNAEPRGRIRATTQRIDIAPTILSYLGAEPPEWMEGQSLLGADLDRRRLIFVAGLSRHEADTLVSLVQCQRYFRLHPGTGEMEPRVLAGHTDPCPESELVGEDEARARILALLADSPHFTEPLMLGGRLFELRERNDSELRREVIQGFLDRAARVRWLDEEMAVGWSHWDFWTYGTSPAGLLVVNRGDAPLRRRLEVHSPAERTFPYSFHVDDGQERHDYAFDRPGSRTVELAAVAPRSERLFVVWSDQAHEAARRRVGVQLAVAFSDRLERLVARREPAAWRRLAAEILADPAARGWLGENLRVANAYWDFWSRADQPLALVARNPGRRRLVPRVVVRSGAGREFPVRFYVDDGETTREHVFTRPGERTVELSPVAARSERLFVLWTDRPWSPNTGDRRVLGIRLASVPLPAR